MDTSTNIFFQPVRRTHRCAVGVIRVATKCADLERMDPLISASQPDLFRDCHLALSHFGEEVIPALDHLQRASCANVVNMMCEGSSSHNDRHLALSNDEFDGLLGAVLARGRVKDLATLDELPGRRVFPSIINFRVIDERSECTLPV